MAAITSKFKGPLYPTEVFIAAGEGGLREDSMVLLNQVRSLDKQRLIRRVGSLERDTMGKVDQALGVSLGLVKI